MYLQRISLIIVFLTISSCSQPQESITSKYNIGVVSYGQGDRSLQKYTDFTDYLGTQLNSLIELEPAYNEIKALEQISKKRWDIVFAPPGLAAIAISEYNYEPIIPLEGRDNTRSVIVVKSVSALQKRGDLAGKVIALGQKGSATGYYLPLYNLYGLNFAKVLSASTPEEVLQLIENGTAQAGALSLAQYNLHRRNFSPDNFRILHLDRHQVPAGAILISDRIEYNQQAKMVVALIQTPSFIASSVGLLPAEKVPDYSYLIKVIERVQEILAKSPARVN